MTESNGRSNDSERQILEDDPTIQDNSLEDHPMIQNDKF